MKRLWNALGKETKSTIFQKKAVKQVEKMEKGEAMVKAPRHEREKKHFEEAQKDERLQKAVAERREELIDNINRIHIKSTDPPERWTSTKELPTRDSEWAHRNDPAWEFGFYEPAPERIPKSKLTFREALELLRMKQELDDDSATPTGAKRREQASKDLEEHQSRDRFSMDQLDLMYKYFRPFERQDKQRVVKTEDLVRLQERLQGWHDPDKIVAPPGGVSGFLKEKMSKSLEKDPAAYEKFEKMDAKERQEFEDAVSQLREEQRSRLEERMKEVKEMEIAEAEAAKEQQNKENEAEKSKGSK
ncbi:unnamed protein product, partial [Mesorhabditis belari]|uniref:Uncharacterized protein n=1 Tax=Mesorhabditis belari TaxID=2138241 RepID=A0AAF3FLK9_9BILA